MISVIIPCFNAVETLRVAYESLPPKAGADAISDLEILIVDDGSTDQGAALIAELAQADQRIVPIYNPESTGASTARNMALSRAQGAFVFFMNAGDRLLPRCLQTLRAEATEDVDFVRARHLLWNSDIDECTENDWEERSFAEVRGIAPTAFPQITAIDPSWNALFRRARIVDLNLQFREDMKRGADRDFNLRYLTGCRKITLLNDHTYLWRKTMSPGQEPARRFAVQPDDECNSILQHVGHLQSGWFTANPRHRTYLATSLVVELGNFLAAFSNPIGDGALPPAAQQDIASILNGMDPSWIDLELPGAKGRTAAFLPLYRLVAAQLSQTPDEVFYRQILGLLGGIRAGLGAGASSGSDQRPSGHGRARDVLARAFRLARAGRSAELRAIERQVLEKTGALDREHYRSLYPDVTKSGIDEIVHYLEFGAAELRDPNDWFCTARYFQDHPELVVSGINPLVRYVISATSHTKWAS